MLESLVPAALWEGFLESCHQTSDYWRDINYQLDKMLGCERLLRNACWTAA
jgi:hypothetical protein